MTLRQVFRKPITQQYPEYLRPVYPRFRGRHRLHRHENGLEKCVGCSLCAAACPADCIRVVADENTPENRVSAGERYARIYEINMSRCIFCGYCEIACPFDAITLGNDYEISEYNRDDLIYTKDMLLAEPQKQVPVADRDLYDTPIPYYKVELLRWRTSSSGASGWSRPSRACAARSAVITFRNPFFSALALIGNLASLAVLYLLLGGEFVAAGPGARLRRRGDGDVPVRHRLPRRQDRRGARGPAARRGRSSRPCLAAGAILVEVIVAIGLSTGGSLSHSAKITRSFGSPESIGRLFLTDQLIAFEVTSIVLLIAAVGGVVLGSHARAIRGDASQPSRRGRGGRRSPAPGWEADARA